jgi:D-glycero-D-manno-heptose 1,7-bisphosphate phosphatase
VLESPHLIDGRGLWQQQLREAQAETLRPALFLDRDGALVEEVGYLSRPEDVSLVAGASAVVRAYNRARFPVIVVTNQSGVGRGYFDWRDFAAVQERVLALLRAEEAELDAVFACAYHADAAPPYNVAAHPWRKPGDGMFRAAATVFGVDLGRSWIVGDAASDILAGRKAGLAGGAHVLTGHGKAERAAALALARDGYEVRACGSIADCLDLVDRMRARTQP